MKSPRSPFPEASLHVDASTGDDARSRAQASSAATPWKTIARALADATPGDTILIAPGLYPEPLRIEVSGVTGGLDLNIVGGSVTVSSTPRELNIESMDGAVRVTGGAAWLRVKTATGDIDVRGGSEDAGLSTVSGTVRVSDGRYERGKFETVTGNVVYQGDVGYKGSLDLTTHSGRIELRLPPRPNLELDAATVTGTIENAVTSSRPIAGREGRGMELGFSSGTGDTRMVVRSFKGDVALKPR